jgi:hypothetical protein
VKKLNWRKVGQIHSSPLVFCRLRQYIVGIFQRSSVDDGAPPLHRLWEMLMLADATHVVVRSNLFVRKAASATGR